MPEIEKKYFSKLLLFGEYTLLQGSSALILPFHNFSAEFDFSGSADSETELSRQNLKQYFSWLLEFQNGYNSVGMDIRQFSSDIQKGLYLKSNIPQGYGVGSSGALVAAVYDRYFNKELKEQEESNSDILLKRFSNMESYFHGKSSGLDPLSCYLGKPLLYKLSEGIKIIEPFSSAADSDLKIFLIDTGMTSRTDGLVRTFIQKSGEVSFQNLLQEKIIPLTNTCIELLLEKKSKKFFNAVKDLSAFQYKYFREMIPIRFLSLWKDGIDRSDFLIKLCGSGGGGYLLGFTRDMVTAELFFREKGIDILPV
ncbi:MAG: mevalonate kinase [Bacteroidales bacterium]|nr:mevalonate kinase [Bacteroidales bacterium]MCB8999089.1 mevalonate kinase [Bacteroidales bacterium]